MNLNKFFLSDKRVLLTDIIYYVIVKKININFSHTSRRLLGLGSLGRHLIQYINGV